MVSNSYIQYFLAEWNDAFGIQVFGKYYDYKKQKMDELCLGLVFCEYDPNTGKRFMDTDQNRRLVRNYIDFMASCEDIIGLRGDSEGMSQQMIDSILYAKKQINSVLKKIVNDRYTPNN